MLKKMAVIGLVLALTAGFATAESQTKNYTAAGGFTLSAGLGFGVTIEDCGTLAEGVTVIEDCNIGGVSFAAHPDGLIPASVDVADSSGGPVSIVICQDTEGDGLCEYGSDASPDPWWAGCDVQANLAESIVPFRADLDTVVFLDFFNDTCPGIATSGTVTLTYL